MSHDSSDDLGVAETIRSLDPAERQALLGRIVHIPSRVQDRLKDKGILTAGVPNWTLYGLLVRECYRGEASK